MNDLWLKFKVWAKVILVALVLIYVILFAVNNSESPATLWFWFGNGREVKTTVLKLVLVTFCVGVLVALLARTTFRTIRQIRELQERQRASRLEKDLSEMKTKAAMLRAHPQSPAASTSSSGETASTEPE